MKKEIVNTIIDELSNSGLFVAVYKNFVPVFNNVHDVPAVAVTNLDETRDRVSNSANKFDIHGLIGVYLYNQYPQDSYENVMDDLIESISTIINNSTTLQQEALDIYVSDVKRDGTLLYPYAMAEITVYVHYRDIC